MIRCFIAILIAAWALASAETISWFSDPNSVNLDSAGQPMDGGFHFQVGAFPAGFEPTVANRLEWSSRWVPAGTAAYNGSTGLYAGEFTLQSNAAPFVVNGKAWVWGIRTTATGSEWILFRHTSWRWPVANPLSPPLIQWNARQANEVVIGSIHASGSPHLMRSAAVAGYAQWVQAELSGEPRNGPEADPDGDGIPNAVEFALGTPPREGGHGPAGSASWFEHEGKFHLQLSVPRRRDRLAVLAVEVSSDLVQWHSGAGYTEVVSDGEWWVVRDLSPRDDANPRRFIRLKVELP